MAVPQDDRFKRPLYVFDLPADVLTTLQARGTSAANHVDIDEKTIDRASREREPGSALLCSTCQISLKDSAEHRLHVKSDWHRYNLRQKLRGLPSVDEPTFDRLIGELDESISGSESSESGSEAEGGENGDDVLTQLLKKQARLAHGDAPSESEDATQVKKAGRSPIFWFTSPVLPPKTSLGVYRALFTQAELQKPDLAAVIAQKQLKPQDGRQLAKQPDAATVPGPSVFLCMIGGGHFAAMVVSLTPKLIQKSKGGLQDREAIVLAHKTFHRYTTRRKQGGAQGANDAAKGAAHSAGANIRRANETALEVDIRGLLNEWREMIDGCDLLFIRATGNTNRRVLFGPYEKQALRANDPRIRSIPFSTRRATQAELMRAFVELTRAKISEIQEDKPESLPGESDTRTAQEPKKKAPPKASPEEEEAAMHTSQLQALIKRSKVPALLQYLSTNSITPAFRFHPPSSAAHRHAPTPLHLASSINAAVVVQSLLVKANADPTITSDDGKAPFELAGDRATRDAFRVARSELGEAKWAWDDAHIPSALSKDEAKAREKADQDEAKSKESERREAEMKRLAAETEAKSAAKPGGRTLVKPEVTAADRREEELRGLTPEQKSKLERERRARAAEERMRRMTAR